MRMPGPDGKLGHAEIRISDSRVMLADEYPQMDFLGPQARGGSAVHAYPREERRCAGGLATHVEDISPAEMRKRAAAKPSSAQ
jgi:uncharacterized glyoxalase superfamily protein PhnB